MSPNATIQDIERILDKTLDRLKFERFTYLILITICIVSIMGVAIYLAIWKDKIEYFVSLLAPTGILTFCLSRIFKIWDDIMKILINLKIKNNEE